MSIVRQHFNSVECCSRQYAKVVVFSKVLLPNYRSDLDDKRPQREVCSYVVAYFIYFVLPTYLLKKKKRHKFG